MSMFTLNMGNTPEERSEQKALAVALVASLLCLGSFAIARYIVTEATANRKPLSSAQHQAPVKLQPAVDLNARFKVIPSNFLETDFYNHNYGSYRFSDGTKVNINLEHGSYFYGERNGWFELKDVHYVDVTHDGKPEALVRLSHVDCTKGECDGGASFFYIFSVRKGNLKPLWQFETGTYGYGCGLKSLTVNDTELVVGMFGEGCHKPREKQEPLEKYVTEHQTYLHFKFDGHNFVQRNNEFAISPKINVMNYQPEIQIFGTDVELQPATPLPSEVRDGKLIYR